MKAAVIMALCAMSACWAQSRTTTGRAEAAYYIASYGEHYRVPIALARAIVERESNWQACTVSPKGAMGLMQLMPLTAERLGVTDRCNVAQNVSGGVRYLAWLMQRFHNDLRLVTAAYYVGEERIDAKGLAYRNADVFAYVSKVRTTYLRKAGIAREGKNPAEKEK